MDPATRDLLSRLLNARGPSGHEEAASAVWREEARSFADREWTDVHGNAFAEIGAGGSPRVMLAGHIDEIGLMVHHIDDDGFLYPKPIGGWDAQVLVGQRVEVLGEDPGADAVVGVVGRPAAHLLEKDDREKAVKIKDLWIDIGVASGDEARARVSVGDVAVIRSDIVEIGVGRLAARSIDDRIGALVALEALRRAARKGVEAHVIAVATTQEEIGGSTGGGARTSSFGLEPETAVVVDVCHATDHPHMDRKEHGDIRLGAGPVLSRGAVVNRGVLGRLREAADRGGIPYQLLAAPSSTGTDADQIFTTRRGVATAVVSIPNRYMHSPNQLIDVSDVEHAAELVAEFLHGLSSDSDFLPA